MKYVSAVDVQAVLLSDLPLSVLDDLAVHFFYCEEEPFPV